MISSSSFKAPWWLGNSHLQTLWSTLVRNKPNIAVRKERLELSDGDFLDLFWTRRKKGPIVIILHGLAGSFQSHYVRGMLWALDQIGWRGVLMHFRGCSGEPNRLPRSYHSGDTTDLATVVETILHREPGTPVAAVGYSLGGNVLLKWLGETGEQNPLIASVAVSVPFDLYSTVQRLQIGFSRVYQRYLLNLLITSAKKKFSLISSPIELRGIEKLNTFHLYDEHVTAPLHGFNSAMEYYTKTSSRQFLKTIRIPTLILQAKDDPFLYAQAIPAADELSPSTILELSDKGGHVGFVSGTLPWQAIYWLEQRIPEFLAEYV